MKKTLFLFMAVFIGAFLMNTVKAENTGSIYEQPDYEFYDSSGCQAAFSYSKGNCDLCIAFTGESIDSVVLWSWDFGDSTSSNERNPAHSYTEAGFYDVCLTIETVDSCVSSFCQTIQVVGDTLWPSDSCYADFSYEVGVCGEICVSFTDESSPNITDWSWFFGDGETSSEQNPTHNYSAPGYYYINLTTKTLDGCENAVYRPILVGDPQVDSCYADFTYEAGGCGENCVAFTDMSSSKTIMWNWHFGAGGSSSEQNPTYTYSSPGTYSVSLTTITWDSCENTTYHTILVGDTLVPIDTCQAAFEWDRAYCGTNCIGFTDISTPNPVNWFWDFGDGETSQEQNPGHDYDSLGMYDVCLTIVTADSCTSTYCETVTVIDTLVPVDTCQAAFGWDRAYCGTNCIGFTDISTPNPVNWFWDFGDGETSQEQNPGHDYDSLGMYDVCLTIVTADSCTSTYCETVTVMDTLVPVDSCQAFYEYSVGSCGTNCVSFSDLSSSNTMSWLWSFGDSTTSTEQNPEKIYAESGYYNVCLDIFTTDSCESSYCQTIWVGDSIVPIDSCQAAFAYNVGSCGLNCVSFNDMSSLNTISWNWNFGDGTTSTEQNPEKTYSTPGLYEVCLNIFTGDSCEDVYCESIWVGDTIPQGDCEANYMHYIQNNGHSVQFIDDSEGDIVSWMWDFGDGNSSSEQNPIHTYVDSGYYQVCLTVFGADSCIDQYCNYVPVTFNPNDSTYSIAGSVHAENEPITSGVVVLFNTDYVYHSAYDYFIVDNGTFEFDEVVPGNYVVYAIPDPSVYPRFFPTYYRDVIFWEEAYIINVNANTYDLDIHLQPMDSLLSGDGIIGGSITFDNTITYEQDIFGQNWFGGDKNKTEIAAMNIPVILKNENGDALAYALSDFTGHYEFTNLHYQGYTINAEKSSLESVSPVVSLNSGNHIYNNVDIAVGTENIVTSVNDKIVNTSISSLKAYPNPFKDNLKVEFNLSDEADVQISILNVTGQVLQSEYIAKSSGEQRVELNLTTLSSGIYFIKVDVNNANSAFVKIVK